jgi:uncharacterized membrane protein
VACSVVGSANGIWVSQQWYVIEKGASSTLGDGIWYAYCEGHGGKGHRWPSSGGDKDFCVPESTYHHQIFSADSRSVCDEQGGVMRSFVGTQTSPAGTFEWTLRD